MLGRLLKVALLVVVAGQVTSKVAKKEAATDPAEPRNYCCYSGYCIPDSWVCDGDYDCPDGNDEENCYATTEDFSTCNPDDFICNDGYCIPYYWECDGYSDCSNGEDEASCVVYTTTRPSSPPTTTPRTTIAPESCPRLFELIAGRCVLVDPFTSTNWDEGRYFCEMNGADIVVFDSLDFFRQVLEFISEKGLTSHDYWIGGTDREVEGKWEWVSGEPMMQGTPLWALYLYNSNYEQEPRPSDGSNADCAFLDRDRFFYVADDDCSSAKAVICEVPTWTAADKKDTHKHRLSPVQEEKIKALYRKFVERHQDREGQHLSQKEETQVKEHATKIKLEKGQSHIKTLPQEEQRIIEVFPRKMPENSSKQPIPVPVKTLPPRQKLQLPKTSVRSSPEDSEQNVKKSVKKVEDTKASDAKNFIASKVEDSGVQKPEELAVKKTNSAEEKHPKHNVQRKVSTTKQEAMEKAREKFKLIRKN